MATLILRCGIRIGKRALVIAQYPHRETHLNKEQNEWATWAMEGYLCQYDVEVEKLTVGNEREKCYQIGARSSRHAAARHITSSLHAA